VALVPLFASRRAAAAPSCATAVLWKEPELGWMTERSPTSRRSSRKKRMLPGASIRSGVGGSVGAFRGAWSSVCTTPAGGISTHPCGDEWCLAGSRGSGWWGSGGTPRVLVTAHHLEGDRGSCGVGHAVWLTCAAALGCLVLSLRWASDWSCKMGLLLGALVLNPAYFGQHYAHCKLHSLIFSRAAPDQSLVHPVLTDPPGALGARVHSTPCDTF
jgi:hypothetical protein